MLMVPLFFDKHIDTDFLIRNSITRTEKENFSYMAYKFC